MQNIFMKFAACWIALALSIIAFKLPMPGAKAQEPMTCSGTLKASAFGATEPTIGGYNVKVTCN